MNFDTGCCDELGAPAGSDLGHSAEEGTLSKVIASITTSVDGYITGPGDGPGCGLGRGGERLHYWVMGGPWTYEGGHDFAMHGPDKEFYDGLVSTMASGVVGRGMYDAAGAWGGTNPFPGTLFVLTHRTADQPAPASGFRFVADLDAALAQAVEAAGDGDVAIEGGADAWTSRWPRSTARRTPPTCATRSRNSRGRRHAVTGHAADRALPTVTARGSSRRSVIADVSAAPAGHRSVMLLF